MNKRVNITREQANKLIEMCVDIFPEYANIKLESRYGTNEVWFDNSPDRSPDPHEFHWFELCVTELPRVIFEKLDSFTRKDENLEHIELNSSFQTGGELLFHCYSEERHVIDELYKEHKKLKRWEQLLQKK